MQRNVIFSEGSESDVAAAAIEGDSQSDASRCDVWHVTDVQATSLRSLFLLSACIEGDVPSPLLQVPAAAPKATTSSSSSSFSTSQPTLPSQSFPTQTSPPLSSSRSRFRNQRSAKSSSSAPPAAVTPSAFDKGGRARVHALARAAKAASAVDEEAKTLRPGSKSGGVKVGAWAGAKQQLGAGRLFSPDRLQNGSAQPVIQVRKQEQDALTAHVQQTPQHRRAQQLHDQDDIVSPREESGGDDVRAAAAAALLRIALIVTDATETMIVMCCSFQNVTFLSLRISRCCYRR